MSFETVPDMESFQQQHQQHSDISKQFTSSDSRWMPSSEDFFDSFVNTDSFHGRNGECQSDFPLDYPSMTDLIPETLGNDTLDDAFLCSDETSFDEAQDSWHDSAGETYDPALPSFDDAFSSNYAPSGSFLSTENDPLLNLDPLHSHTELDLVALPASPSDLTPVWPSNHDDLQETTSFTTDAERRRKSHAEDSESNKISSHLDSSRPRGRQPVRNHTMLAQRWEDSAHADHAKTQSSSDRKEVEQYSQPLNSYPRSRGDGQLQPSNRSYQPQRHRFEADSAPLYREITIPEREFDDTKLKKFRLPHSPIGSASFKTTLESRTSSFLDTQPDLTFSSYPSTPRSHAEDPSHPMTPPQVQADGSQPWKHDQADALQNGKAEEWWNLPTGQSGTVCDATIIPHTLGLGITNLQSTSLGESGAYLNERKFSPDASIPTSAHSGHFSCGSRVSASFDSSYTVPQAQMLPLSQQHHMQSQAYGHNQSFYQPNPANFSPAPMSHQSFNSPGSMTALPYLNNIQRASSMASSNRASSIAFSRASSYRSSPSPSPGLPHAQAPDQSHSLPRSSNRRDQRKQNRRSASRATNHSSRESSRATAAPAAELGGFINYTPNDKKRILTGVAPSGSSKTKARREKEAAEQKRKMSEAAKRAVLTGDMTLLERSFGRS